MPGGTNRSIKDSERIALLERELSILKQQIANLRTPKPRTNWSEVRLARTVDDGDYTGSGSRHPIVFVDAVWNSGDEEVDLTDGSDERQDYALSVEPLSPGIGGLLYVEQTEKGAWLVVDAAEGLGIGETESGGINAGGSGTVTAKVLNSDGTLSTALDEASDPIEETVYGVFGDSAGSTLVAYARDKRSGRLFIVAEACPS